MLLKRPIRTRFRYGSPTRVNLATHRKLAGSFFKRHAVTTVCASTHSDAPTACRHTVSGTISLRSRGTFHHSLTVLSAIGHQGVFRLSGWSRQIHTGFLGPRATWDTLREPHMFRLRGYYPLCRRFRIAFDYTYGFSLADRPADRSEKSHDPAYATPAGYHTQTV